MSGGGGSGGFGGATNTGSIATLMFFSLVLPTCHAMLFFILSFTSFYLHLAAIPVDPLYGDPATQVLLEPAVEGDALPDVVDHREELEEGGERWPTIFWHAHLGDKVRLDQG